MDHICISSLQFMEHGHTHPAFGIRKFHFSNQISFGQMDINNHRSTLNTFVGNKSTMSKEEIAIPAKKYSQLVGGFVGSKSQLGTSNRISCQIWDIVFCKLMSFMNSSNMKSASTLGSSEYSYTFVEDLATDVFDSMCSNISERDTPPAGSCAVGIDTQVFNNLTPVNSEKHNQITESAVLHNSIAVPEQELHGVKLKESCKQSYADVTKTTRYIGAMKGNVKRENILCSKSTIRTKNEQLIPGRELNNTSKRKKRNCRRKKENISDFNTVKPQNSCKKGGGKYLNDQKKRANLKLQNVTKQQKNISASDMTNHVPENAECDVNGTHIMFTNKPISENTSLDFKKGQKSSTSFLPKQNKAEFEFVAHFEKNCAYSHMMVTPKDTLQNCDTEDTEFENSITEEDDFLPKKPSFSDAHVIHTPKANRLNSDSSDSDDFVIFAIAETDVQIESASDEDIEDCFSDCDFEEWDTQEKDTDEVDNQVTENLRTINEKWDKLYSSFPGNPKEPKKVRFASNGKLKTVHSIIAWDFAYRAARIGCWQRIALDQERFMRRILQLEQIISPVLTTEHRQCMRQRIMKFQ